MSHDEFRGERGNLASLAGPRIVILAARNVTRAPPAPVDHETSREPGPRGCPEVASRRHIKEPGTWKWQRRTAVLQMLVTEYGVNSTQRNIAWDVLFTWPRGRRNSANVRSSVCYPLYSLPLSSTYIRNRRPLAWRRHPISGRYETKIGRLLIPVVPRTTKPPLTETSSAATSNTPLATSVPGRPTRRRPRPSAPAPTPSPGQAPSSPPRPA